MLFCVPLPAFLKSKNKKSKSTVYQTVYSEAEYQQWKLLFEAAKNRTKTVARRETEDISLFLEKYRLDKCLDDGSVLEEDVAMNKSNFSNESFEETVSWQYFNMSDDDSVDSGSGTLTSSGSDTMSSSDSDTDTSFTPDTLHCSTLRKSAVLRHRQWAGL